jgi:hypothetical protein
MSTKETQQGCDACNKSGLSLLLLRPSPIAKDAKLAPLGAEAVSSADATAEGQVPARKPTESRTLLRLLREGFVHVYIPSPPPGLQNWLVYRVTPNADLVAEGNPVFSQMPQPPACGRESHNKAGMRLLHIPQAHMIGSIWIAYSANLWGDKLKSQNAANPKAMQQVSLQGGGRNTFKPTTEALKSQVLECALASIRAKGAEASAPQVDQDFPFVSMAGEVQSLADNLQRAAACHPKTKGLELAVVLRDPVGFVAELNAIRLWRHELARTEIEKPENAHPLNSSNALLGLKKSVLDINLTDSFVQVSPLKTKAAFDQAKDLPVGTQWHALSPEERLALSKAASGSDAFGAVLLSPYKRAFEQPNLGRVVYPDHDARALAWANEQTAKTWGPIAKKYDEVARAAWVSAFEAKMKAAHHDPLVKYEDDWIAAAHDAQLLAYFADHFDDQDPNDPKKLHSPGATYARESQYVYTPAPITTGPVLDTYLTMLDKPVSDKSAVVQRALVGNQASVFESMQAYAGALYQTAIGDPGADPDQGGGMRDKAYDFMKGLYNESKALKQYGWLGNAIGVFSTHHLAALTAAGISAVARSNAASPALMRGLGKVQGLWGVQQAVELVVQGALSGNAAKVPLLITMKVDVADALAVLRARKGQDLGVSRSQVKKLRGSGAKIKLSVLTDSDALRAAQGDVNALLKDANTGTVGMKGAATSAAAAGGAVVLSQEQFLALYAKQSQVGATGVQAVRQALVQGTADIRSITLSLDGRLAIGSIFVQALGLLNGLKALESGKDQRAVRDAWYGIYDSTAGTMGGLLEMWAVAVNSRALAQAGTEAAKRSLPLGALRFAGNIAGAAGGAVNAVAAWAKAEDALAAGDIGVARLYYGSMAAFTGTVATSTVIAFSAGANTLAARGIGGIAGRGVLLRIGAAGTAEIIGLSVSGWGLVLLGAGVLFQVGATVLTPTPMQKWASRSYFGKADDKYPQGDWKAEFDGLQKALNTGSDEAAQQPARAAETQAGNSAVYTPMGDLASP